MKKILCFLVCLLLLFSVSCEKCRATDKLAELCTACGEIPPIRVFFADGYDDAVLDEESAALLYGSAEYLDAAEDYAIAVTASTELFELHVIRPKSGREEEAVKLLEGRISVLRSSGMEEYDPAVYYNIIENAEPEKSDGFVILKVIRNSENQ